MDYARLKGWFIFHIANEGNRGPHIARDQGILAGCPDYVMPMPSAGKHALFLEMKRPGGKPGRRQLVFLELLRRNNYAAAWFDQWTDAVQWIEAYLSSRTPVATA